jgi:activating signal cointegrator 1
MKALSLLQPWASLVVSGHKTLETRRWTTAYRGPLVIHASLSKGGREIAGLPRIRRLLPDFDTLPFGAVLGTVELTAVLRAESLDLSAAAFASLSLEEQAFGREGSGHWAWMLAEPRRLRDPVPAKGSLGLWEFPDEWLTFD